MTRRLTFRLERFFSLSGSELISYAEQFVNADAESISEDAYIPLKSALGTMDEIHTVYAMEVCARLKPRDFVARAVDFLVDPDIAVCLTAYRIIQSLPWKERPLDVVAKISRTAVVDLFGPDLLHPGKRIHLGTNEKLLRDILAPHHGKCSGFWFRLSREIRRLLKRSGLFGS
jgi:hypothetical protein